MIAVWHSKMGSVPYAHKVVGYAPVEFWGLTRMKKDDVPTVWKTLDTANKKMWRMGQFTCTPREMDQDIWRRGTTWVGASVLSYPIYHTHESVYWGGALPWHERMGCHVWRILVNLHVWGSLVGYYWWCATRNKSIYLQNTSRANGSASARMGNLVELHARVLQCRYWGEWWGSKKI